MVEDKKYLAFPIGATKTRNNIITIRASAGAYPRLRRRPRRCFRAPSARFKNELERTKGLSKSTVKTHISRLRAKGVVTHHDKYGAAQYYPLVSEDEYILSEQTAVIEKLGGAEKFMAAMVRGGHLREADIDELRGYFKMGGGRDE
jgi:predicted transcriptional regulator